MSTSRTTFRAPALSALAILALLAGASQWAVPSSAAGVVAVPRLSARRLRVPRHAGALRLDWLRLAVPAAARLPTLAPGRVDWLEVRAPRRVVVMTEAWPRSGGRPARARRLALLGLAIGPHAVPLLLGALGRDTVLAAVAPSDGTHAGVVANVWAVGPGGRLRLANLDPVGTRPRLLAGRTVAAVAADEAILARGARGAFPFRPARDLLVRARGPGAQAAVCPLPVAVPPGAVVDTGAQLLVPQDGRLLALTGCPGPVRMASVGSIPRGLAPLLAGLVRRHGRASLAWVAGTAAGRLGAWGRDARGDWRRIWAVADTALAVTPLPPDLLAVTAPEGSDGSATLFYRAPTGQSAGPFRAIAVVATGDGAAVVRRGGRLWLVRPTHSGA